MGGNGIGSYAQFALAVCVACSLLAFPATAQTNFNGHDSFFHGVPPSVTSFGFGGSPGFHGIPASVTSPGFGSTGFRFRPGFNPGFVGHAGFGFHHRRHNFISPYYGSYYLPYAYPVYDDMGVDDSMEQDSGSGPTVFDRSGGPRQYPRTPPSQDDYRTELNSKPQPSEAPAVQQPVAEQPATVLVFKDGHHQEIVNYAIVGSTLYDLSGGRTRKVALAELDLTATVKQNDERGVDFQLPAGSKLN